MRCATLIVLEDLEPAKACVSFGPAPLPLLAFEGSMGAVIPPAGPSIVSMARSCHLHCDWIFPRGADLSGIGSLSQSPISKHPRLPHPQRRYTEVTVGDALAVDRLHKRQLTPSDEVRRVLRIVMPDSVRIWRRRSLRHNGSAGEDRPDRRNEAKLPTTPWAFEDVVVILREPDLDCLAAVAAERDVLVLGAH